MISERQILDALDHSNDGFYCDFIPLNHPYSYLIDTRLNLFRNEKEWAIAAEILGYNPRGSRIELNIFYYGNCLINLERYNNRDTNYYDAAPINDDYFRAATADGLLNPEAAILLLMLPLDLPRRIKRRIHPALSGCFRTTTPTGYPSAVTR